MRVLIFGGRKFNDQGKMQAVLNEFYLANGPITFIIHGCASGADRMGQMFARQWLGIPDSGETFKADWGNIAVEGAVIKEGKHGKYNAIAGHMRNQRMINEGFPEYGIKFEGGTGTADMQSRLVKAGIPVWDGTL